VVLVQDHRQEGAEAVNFTYLYQQPARYTFEMPKLKSWVESWCTGKTLNLFAGKTLLSIDEYRVDSDKDMPADYHGDAADFVETTDMRFQTVILDPPYNLRKSREKYQGRYIGSLTKIKRNLPRILDIGGRIISLGYDTVGISNRNGFKKLAIVVVCHGGDHNDTLGVVEEYYQPSLSEQL
jgi:hypothetical protein